MYLILCGDPKQDQQEKITFEVVYYHLLWEAA